MKKADIKRDFPLLLKPDTNGVPIAYLDNAATTQKPRSVIEAVSRLYETYNANPHRGAYSIGVEVTEKFEETRRKVAAFIDAKGPQNIVFTSGTTDAVNMAALSYGMKHVEEGDEILVSVLEHHSNLLPWQRLARQKNATLRFLLPDGDGRISPKEVRGKLTDRTKILAVTHVSNVLGAVNPIRKLAALAHEKGAVIFVDAAQSVPHIPVSVTDLDVDFLAFSGHKMLAPDGVGVLYGKGRLLQEMEPLRLGGGMVELVTQQDVRYMDAPWKHEAGTPNAEGVIGLGAAIDYLGQIGFDAVQAHENHLTGYALEKLSVIPDIQLYGAKTGEQRTGILSFNVRDVHPHDTATILASHGVAVRAGHHCAQPLMEHLGVNATCRMSLYLYNTEEDIDRLVSALLTVRGVLGFESE